MKIYGVTETQVQRIIDAIENLDYRRLETVGTRIPHVEVTLRVRDSRGRYAKLGRNGRRTVAACYHAHYRFLAIVYALNPSAQVVSALMRYNDARDFVTKAPELAYSNIGSRMEPQCFKDACECAGER